MPELDVTDKVRCSFVDDEFTSIKKCVCGAEHASWEQTINIYSEPNWVHVMSCCGRKLYFRMSVRVFEVTEDEATASI